jgi:hypothetical protein
MIEEGKPASTFTLPSDSGEDVSLESFRGKPVVLYSYPKDDSRPDQCSDARRCFPANSSRNGCRRSLMASSGERTLAHHAELHPGPQLTHIPSDPATEGRSSPRSVADKTCRGVE